MERYLALREPAMKPRSFTGTARYLRQHAKPLHRLALADIDRRAIAAEFDMSQRAAYRFINVAERYGGKLASLASLNLEAIYEPRPRRRRTSASSGPDALEVPRQDRRRRQSPLERGAAA
jgi:hypothetical protein